MNGEIARLWNSFKNGNAAIGWFDKTRSVHFTHCENLEVLEAHLHTWFFCKVARVDEISDFCLYSALSFTSYINFAKNRKINITLIVYKIVEHWVVRVVGRTGSNHFRFVEKLNQFRISGRNADLKQIARHNHRVVDFRSGFQHFGRERFGILHVSDVLWGTTTSQDDG